MITLEPLPLTAFILVLSSKGGVRKGAAFIFGWLLSLAIVIAFTVLVTGNKPPKPSTAPSLAALAAKLAIGVGLTVIAIRHYQKMGKPKPPKKPPRWQTGHETAGAVIGEVAGGRCGARPAAERAGVPHTTARGWLRRFRSRAEETGVAFAALAVELGGEAVRPPADPGRFALAAIGAAFEAACALPGWAELGVWRFASSVSGGRLIAANMISPFLIVGRRRFMPPIPPLPA